MTDTSAINDQITDSIQQIQQMLADDDGQNVRMFSYQLTAHALSLAMYNTVHQQQQMYILQNAVTTAAAKAILESDPEQALKLAREGFASQDMTATLSELKKFMDELNAIYSDISTGSEKQADNNADKKSDSGKKA